ncbi:integrase arm-type DNA-binding domain-containing protein [Gluconobacter cerinus]|uniref:tyrosine-type recombinase/integrase n=1 Tax=Gluconobacter cerinus TaxID=38307 RepID=UPI001B8D27A8|nr:integrase arm-type DNA-binding domain-containing protein [Gluconobacter cerinus]MBS1040986.1 integrase arm-type DNA-binding domain-containing protein [Gluconobacter cerinus]MBS1047953.1 integrase arm-type DNA-binding domain-containing protein [Gluconobacter cerinus]
MLTDSQVRAAKPKEKSYKLSDGKGLYLQVTPAGGKHWRWRYEIDGKEKTYTIGSYPEVRLPDARSERDEARKVRQAGRDPAKEKKFLKAVGKIDPKQTFIATAKSWYEQRKDLWTERHAADVWRCLERDVFPSIGHMPINDLTAKIVLAVLREIEKRGAVETAHRTRQRMSDIFIHAIACGYGEADPAAIVAPALRPVIRGRQPAITDLGDARIMIRKVEAQDAHPITLLALRLLYLTAVRPGEVRFAMWSEFEDLDGLEPLWRIPAERMKMKREHLVPLSRQVVDVLKALRPLSGRWPHLFPNARRPKQVMSENAIGYLLNRGGYHQRHVPHGFRATFSSSMNELFPGDRQAIDLMLAHVMKDKVEGAYNRSSHLVRRRELYQTWADLILEKQASVSDLVNAKRRPSPGV